MLGDNPEKSKNPLKKAMRRRNAKTVNFAPPTYYEPEERQWSDEDDEEEADDGSAAHIEENTAEQEQQRAQQQSQQVQQTQQIRQSNEQQRAQPTTATMHHVESNEGMNEYDASSPVKSEVQAPAPLQINSQDSMQRSRNGVVRNTDSFFKDQETKKISLTPRLLRGDSDANGPVEQEVKQQPSLDTVDKTVADEKPKDGKKKEKKGMLSGLFKRTKSGKGGKNEPDETDRISEDSAKSPQSKDSMDSETTPDRKPSKLQKAPPAVTSPKMSPTDTRAPQRDLTSTDVQQQAPIVGQTNQSISPQQLQPPQELPADSLAQQPSRFPSLQEKRSVGAKITDVLRSKNSSQDMGDPTVKPVYAKRAKERFAIDESDSENDSTPTTQSSVLHRSISPLENDGANDERPVSHMRLSPLEDRDQAKIDGSAPPPEPEPEPEPVEQFVPGQQMPVEPTPASPSDQTASTSKQSPSIPTHTPSTSRSTPTWSDSSLRSYMDNDQDIRDLLVIVHDKTNVTPVGPEHPLMNGLFASERTKLADMQSQLDSMLLSWLSKKNQPTAAKV